MLRLSRALLENETGASAVEYGLLSALVALTSMIALESAGGSLEGVIAAVTNAVGTILGAVGIAV
jgi:Flp pilus assembly pilin Flp